MFDLTEKASSLHLFVHHYSDELQNAALLLGGRSWFRRAVAFCDALANTPERIEIGLDHEAGELRVLASGIEGFGHLGLHPRQRAGQVLKGKPLLSGRWVHWGRGGNLLSPIGTMMVADHAGLRMVPRPRQYLLPGRVRDPDR